MRTPTIILAGLAALTLSLAAGPAAQASVTYSRAASFATKEAGGPLGVAVDQASGDVYVANSFSSHERLDKFTAAGGILAPPSPFGNGATEFSDYWFSGVAVDPVNGHLYTVEGKSHELQTYDGSSGTLLSNFSIAGSANLFGLFTAVQIASDSAGNVYLPNAPNNEVQEFDPEGNVLVTFTGSGGEALKEPTGVAVDRAGDVYVADNGNGRLEEFSPAGAFLMALGTGVDQTTKGDLCTAASGDTCGPGTDGSQAVALDAAGDIFVGENGGSGFHVALYSPAGEKLTDFGLGTIGSSPIGAIDTVAVGPTGLVYVADGGNDLVWIYAQQSRVSIASESSLAVTHTTATLKTTIDTGNADTTYRFEYGTSAAYGASIPVPGADIGAGLEGPVTTGQELSDLQPGTTYHYRVVASNALGQAAGADQTFTTLPSAPPVVATGQAGGVAQNAATLMGTIDTQGFETVYEFDIGVDTSYGTRIFGDAGVESGVHTFAFALQGLKAGETYHYRILATNTFGTTYGVDQTFTTATYPSATLAGPESPPLLPTPLLAPAGGTTKGSGSATASAARGLAAHSARHRKAARRSARGPDRHGRRSSGRGHAHSGNRRSK